MEKSGEFATVIRTLRLDGRSLPSAPHCLDLLGANQETFSRSSAGRTTPQESAANQTNGVLTAVDREVLADLRKVKDEFPDILAEVRLRDSVIELEFIAPLQATSRFLRLIARKHMLAILLVAYLFHEQRVRASGVVGERTCLQFWRAALADDSQRSHLQQSVRGLCQHLRTENVCALTRFLCTFGGHDDVIELLAPQGLQLTAPINGHAVNSSPSKNGIRAAWVFHLVDAYDLPNHEPSFHGLDAATIERALHGFGPFAAPMALPEVALNLAGGQHVTLFPIWLPVTSRAMKHWLDRRQLQVCRTLLSSAVDLAHKLDCRVVSLGQFTSIVSRNGKSLLPQVPPGVALTNGNSYTVSLAIQAIARVLKTKQIESRNVTLLVGGAVGNIGRVCAEALAPHFRETLLLGSSRPGSMERLRTLSKHVPRAAITIDLNDVRRADVVILALNAVDAPLAAHHFAPGAIVCDISVPAAVSDDVLTQRPDLTLLRGGIAQLPGGEALGIPHFPLPPGKVFGCMAEGILLAAAGISDHGFTGRLSAAHVQRVEQLASRYGIELADAHCANLFGQRAGGANGSD